jgi:hypothetical protein
MSKKLSEANKGWDALSQQDLTQEQINALPQVKISCPPPTPKGK